MSKVRPELCFIKEAKKSGFLSFSASEKGANFGEKVDVILTSIATHFESIILRSNKFLKTFFVYPGVNVIKLVSFVTDDEAK